MNDKMCRYVVKIFSFHLHLIDLIECLTARNLIKTAICLSEEGEKTIPDISRSVQEILALKSVHDVLAITTNQKEG
jgi:hypothetical protein